MRKRGSTWWRSAAAKGFAGPQASGLLLGRKDLIEAAHLNNNPRADTVGRGMKVGKEEIMGLLAAVEVYLSRDHEADQRLWRGFMESIAKDLKGIPGVKAEVYVPGPGGHPIPYVRNGNVRRCPLPLFITGKTASKVLSQVLSQY